MTDSIRVRIGQATEANRMWPRYSDYMLYIRRSSMAGRAGSVIVYTVYVLDIDARGEVLRFDMYSWPRFWEVAAPFPPAEGFPANRGRLVSGSIAVHPDVIRIREFDDLKVRTLTNEQKDEVYVVFGELRDADTEVSLSPVASAFVAGDCLIGLWAKLPERAVDEDAAAPS